MSCTSVCTQERTDILDVAAIWSSILHVCDKIELERILLLTIFSNESLLILDNILGLGCKDNGRMSYNAGRILVPLPHFTCNLHVLIKGQAFTFAVALIGGCVVIKDVYHMDRA